MAAPTGLAAAAPQVTQPAVGATHPAGRPSTRPPYRKYAAPSTAATPGTKAQQSFINQIAPGAIAAQQRFGVPASVTIAQAIDESAWGTSGLASQDYNLFGIKGGGPAGSVTLPTQEYEGGQWVTIDAPFRVYHNIAESIADHAELLATSGYYQRAMADRAVPDAFANDLTGVYATDPEYGSNLIALMRLYNLYRFDAPGTHQQDTPAVSHTPAATAQPTASPAPSPGQAVIPGVLAPTPSAAPSSPAASPSSPAATPSPSVTPSPATTPTPTTTPSPVTAPSPVTTPTPTSSSTPAPGATTTPTTSAAPASSAPAPAPAATSPATPASPTTPASAASPSAGAGFPSGSAAIPGLAPVAQTAAVPQNPAVAHTTAFVQDSPLQQTAPVELRAAVRGYPPAPQRAQATTAVATVPGPARIPGLVSPAAPRYQAQLPGAVTTAYFATAKTPLARSEPLYRDVASQTGIRWELLAACDWMQCQAQPRLSPVRGERIGMPNPDGTVYMTKSEALAQCASELIYLAGAVYRIDLTAPVNLSVRALADAFAAFRWGALLKRHRVSAMEFPYSVAGLTAQHLKMHWPAINDPDTPDKPGGKFRMAFGAVPVVLCLNYPATV